MISIRNIISLFMVVIPNFLEILTENRNSRNKWKELMNQGLGIYFQWNDKDEKFRRHSLYERSPPCPQEYQPQNLALREEIIGKSIIQPELTGIDRNNLLFYFLNEEGGVAASFSLLIMKFGKPYICCSAPF